MKFYLAGPISHDSDSTSWRDAVIEEAKKYGIVCIDPTVTTVRNDADDTIERVRAIKKAIATGDMDKLADMRAIVRPIMRRDLASVARADAVIYCVKEGVRAWGTICEAFYAKWILGKPVVLLTTMSAERLNGWELAIIDALHDTPAGAVQTAKELVEEATK